MNLEDIILKIIKNFGLSRKEIQQLIIRQKSEMNNTISDKVALIIVARSLCIDI